MALTVESLNRRRILDSSNLECISSIFTVSREDVFDYKRCPKIVAIKTYRKTRTRKERSEPNDSGIPLPNIVGQIGEAAVRLAFSGTDERDESFGECSLVHRKTEGKRIA